MEIFRQHGIAEDIIREGTPHRQLSQVVWQTSLAGNGPLDRKVLGFIHTWGCKEGSERNVTYQYVITILFANADATGRQNCSS